jgi:hypothetical protein
MFAVLESVLCDGAHATMIVWCKHFRARMLACQWPTQAGGRFRRNPSSDFAPCPGLTFGTCLVVATP